MPRLTKRTVDAAKPEAGQRFIVWDSTIKGFGLLVLPSGIKSYFLQYRTAEGRSRRATIGRHGSFTPTEARKRAEEMHRAVRAGGDPLAERRARRDALTVGELLDAYFASAAFAEKTEETRVNDRSRGNRHLRPLLGKQPADRLTVDDVRRTFRQIAEGKTAFDEKTRPRGRVRVRGGEGAARMSIRLLSSAFSWAVAERLAPANPCRGVKLGSDGTRDTILEDAESYRNLFATIDRLEAEKRLRSPAADAIRVLALCGARRGEIAALKWSHVDLKAGRIVLPPRGHKAGKRTGKPKIIDLPSAAMAIIAAQPRGEADDLVFPPSKGERPVNLSHVWRTVRAAAGVDPKLTLHGLRHSLGSHMAMASASGPEIMRQLGHAQITTTTRYLHWAERARQQLAEKAAAVALAGLAASKDGVKPADVMSIAGGKP